MAPVKNKRPKMGPAPAKASPAHWKKYLNYDYMQRYIFDPNYITPACTILLIFEVFLNIFIIERVKYTEIDWIAYMQQIEAFTNGTLDYKELKGDTGPLVYPAGFVYIYTLFYYITGRGANIHLAQYIFMCLYLIQTYLLFEIYKKTSKVPPFAIVIATLTSYRIHSIYVLRLFNDPIAVIFFYLSLNLIISNRWRLASVCFSLAVSIKMNILLYAPCFLIAYLTNLSIIETLVNLTICGMVQLFLGAPFLLTNPVSYLWGSFDLSRIFDHQWTVNFRFLPRDVFENRLFHISLLIVHLALLALFLPSLKKYLSSYAKLRCVQRQVNEQIRLERAKRETKNAGMDAKEREFIEAFENGLKNENDGGGCYDVFDKSVKLEQSMHKVTQLLVLPFFVTNLIGVACARSLHYQFYAWYFHSLLYLVMASGYTKPVAFLLLGLIEYCWNVYPSTVLSSGLLHCCHVVLLAGIYRNMNR